MKFYKCPVCGNIVYYFKKSAVDAMCCGKKMVELLPNTTDAAGEKHVPVVKVDGNLVTVEVGSVTHPMLEVHYIEWIVLETTKGFHVKHLKPGEQPKANFVLVDEVAVKAYEYCNLHGLWSN